MTSRLYFLQPCLELLSVALHLLQPLLIYFAAVSTVLLTRSDGAADAESNTQALSDGLRRCKIRLCNSFRLPVAKRDLHASRSTPMQVASSRRDDLCELWDMRCDEEVDGLTRGCRVLMARDALRSVSMTKSW